MPKLLKSAQVNYTPEQLFNLVADVEKYPAYLPFCENTYIHTQTDTTMLADMTLAYKGFSGTFQSNITKQYPNKIHIQQAHGQLKHLYSTWQFNGVTSQELRAPSHSLTAIDFSIDFEANSWLIGKMISPILDSLGNLMMQSFLNRAKQLYDS
jgi:coenzyme Q-binding protein COQ10